MRKKLLGVHPSDIIGEELETTNHKHIQSVMPNLKRLLAGRSDSYRSNVCSNGSTEDRNALSVEAQVECLIDLATDPNICIRSWAGLTLHL